MCGKHWVYKSIVFGCVEGKGVRGANFGCVARIEVRGSTLAVRGGHAIHRCFGKCAQAIGKKVDVRIFWKLVCAMCAQTLESKAIISKMD